MADIDEREVAPEPTDPGGAGEEVADLFSSGFDAGAEAADSGTPVAPAAEQEAATSSPDGDQDDPAGEPKAENKDPEKGGEAKPRSAQEIAEARGIEIEAQLAGGKEPVREEPPPPPVQETKQELKPAVDAEPIAPLAEFTVNGRKITKADIDLELGENAADYMLAASQQIAEQMARQAIEGAIKSGTFITAEKAHALEAQLSYERFLGAVAEKHPDVRSVQRAEGFGKWLDAQSARVRLLADSPDPTDAILVLDAYKEDLATQRNKTLDGKAAKEKARQQDMYRDQPRDTNTGRFAGGSKEGSFSGGFNKAVAELEG